MSEVHSTNHNWEASIVGQGVNLDIPQQFTDSSRFPPGSTLPDRLTGIPIETNVVRQIIAKNLGDCVRNNQLWACLYSDGDQLKVANTKVDRDFGDVFIKWTTAQITQGIKDDLPPNLHNKVVIVRPATGSDEVLVWFFDITPEESRLIKVLQQKLDSTSQGIHHPPFTFSQTVTLISPEDEDIKKQVNETRDFLEGDAARTPLDLYKLVEDEGDRRVKEAKIDKELFRLSNLPPEELIQPPNLTSFIALICSNVGGGRVSESVLETILKLQSIQTIRLLQNKVPRTIYEKMLRDLGISEKDLAQAKTAGALVGLFQQMFGQE